MPQIHPSAVVDPGARLADDVQVGPHAFIDADVTIGPGCRILHGAHIGRWSRLGANNTLYPGAVVGHDPQDVGYKGEEAWTEIGDGNIIREGVTIHRGNRPGTHTRVGDHNFFMVNSHIAHNCLIGNHVILVNGALLAGHVEVGDRAIISGNCQVHQFVRIGPFAMMRGGSGAAKDVPPSASTTGSTGCAPLTLSVSGATALTPAASAPSRKPSKPSSAPISPSLKPCNGSPTIPGAPPTSA